MSAYCVFSGILLLCQQNNCDELSPSTPSLASSSSASTKDLDLTTSTIKSTQNSSHDVLQMKTSIISTTTTHTTRLHQVITATSNDEALMEATTSIDGLCLTKDGADESDNYSIKSISGDIIVTIILRHSDNATEIIKFIVKHINEIDLLVHNVTIGKFLFLINRQFSKISRFFSLSKAFELCKFKSHKICWTFSTLRLITWKIAWKILSVS